MVRVAEFDVDAAVRAAVTVLLRESFPDYPDRSYFKLPPHLRLLAYLDGVLVGHLGVEPRLMRVGEQVVRAVGVVDLCVRARGRGIASRLLAEVCALDGEYAVLFADDDRVYVRNGFTHVDVPVTWLKIHEHRSLGLSERVVPGGMMVRPLAGNPWPAGEIDLLGHLF